MTVFRTAEIAWLAAVGILAVTRSASASDNCDGVHLDLADDLSPEWREAGQRLRTELVASDAPCVSATLTVESAPGGARLLATSAEGHTTRMITRVASLIPTALGIVASLPPDAIRTNDEPARVEKTIVADAPAPTESSSLPTDPSPQAWIGAAVGARVGGPTWIGMMDLEGRFSVESRKWLIVASFRYGTSLGESGVSTDDTYYELVGSLGVGRRFAIGSSVLDVDVFPALAGASLNDNDDDDAPSVGPRAEMRLGMSACWWTEFSDGSRINLTADTDAMPYGFFHALRTSSTEPAMPVWTLGVRLGASGRIL